MGTFATIQDRAVRLVENVFPLPESLLLELLDCINQQQRRACELHAFRATETEGAFVTVAGTHTLAALPADWRSPRGRPYRVTNQGIYRELDWLPSTQDMVRTYDDMTTNTGPPRYVLERATDLAVYPFSNSQSDWPDKQYRVRVPYYRYFADLSAASDTNWLTQNAETFLVYATVGELLLRAERPEAATWLLSADPIGKPQTATDREWRRLLRTEKLARLGTDPVVMPRRDVLASFTQRRS